MANYLESLLGEEELQQAKNQALSSGLMQAGFAGLLGSGPSLLPTSAGQAIGQAGLAGMSAYDSALDQAKQNISQKSIQGIISGTLSGSGNNVANTENMADKFTKLAERFAPIDPTKSKLYYDLAEQSRGKSEKFTGNLANSALELFGTADLAKLTPEQRTQASKYAQSQAMSTASAGATRVTMPPNTQVGSIPPGYYLKVDNATGTMQMAPIPGGPVDSAQNKLDASTQAQKTSSNVTKNIVIQDINRAQNIAETNPTATGVMSKMALLNPESDASSLVGILGSIKSNIGLDKIMSMRAESPTGAGLGGATSDRDMATVQSIYGQLNPAGDPKVLNYELIRLNNAYLDSVHGTPTQIQGLIDSGKVTKEIGLELMKRQNLPKIGNNKEQNQKPLSNIFK